MHGPVLRGERVSLEPSRREDVALVNGWWADLEVVRFWPDLGVPSLQQTEEAYERSARDASSVLWRLVAGGRTIGSVWIAGVDWWNRQAESGLLIGDTLCWGKGYATEAVKLRTRYAFEELNLLRLESHSAVKNVAMHRALEKAGYTNIGQKHGSIYRRGDWIDVYVFELRRADWRPTED